MERIISKYILDEIHLCEKENEDIVDAIYTLYIHVVPSYITNYDNDKYYVGITKQSVVSRWGCDGRGYIGQPFYNAILKYNWNNIEHYIVSNNLTKEQAYSFEIAVIDDLQSYDRRYGYNIQLGGSGELDKDNTQNYPFVDLTGKLFGSLLVIKRADDYIRESGRKIVSWNCTCLNCGKENVIYTSEALVRKNKTDCGCISKVNKSESSRKGSLKRYLANKKIEIFDDYYIYYFNTNKLIFDIQDYDRTVDLFFYRNNTTYYYSYDFSFEDKINVNSLFYDNNKCNFKFVNNKETYDFRRSNLCITHKKQQNKVETSLKDYDERAIQILQFDLNNNVINSYQSISEASRKTGINKCNISACCKNRQSTAGGFVWKYKDTDGVATKTDIIYQFDLNANLINEYDSLLQASLLSGIKESTLYKALHSDTHFSNNYLWSHDLTNVKPYERKKSNNNGHKLPVVSYDIDSHMIVIYDSISDASKDTNVDRSSIIRCCNNKQKIAGNYKWKYKHDIKETDDIVSFFID